MLQRVARERRRHVVSRERQLLVPAPTPERDERVHRRPFADLRAETLQKINRRRSLRRRPVAVAERVRLERLHAQLRDGAVEKGGARRFGSRRGVYRLTDLSPRRVALGIRRRLRSGVGGEGTRLRFRPRREAPFAVAPEPSRRVARQHVRGVASHEAHVHVRLGRHGVGRFAQRGFLVAIEDKRRERGAVDGRTAGAVAGVWDGGVQRAAPRALREGGALV